MRLLRSSTDPVSAFLHRPPRLRVGRRTLSRFVAWAGIVVGVAWGVAVGWTVANDNLREVQPGRVYRAGQMSPERLHDFLGRSGVRTVVNLRGYCGDFDWYRDECRVTHERNISQEDVTLSAIRLPAPSEIRRLVEILDHSEYPLLLHCRQGVDRTGLAAVIVKLLEPGVSLAKARRQLGLMYGYVPYNGTENMNRFFDLYQEWLDRLERSHSPDLFRHWAVHEYCPGRCRARLEWTKFPASPVRADRAFVLRFQAHNTSVQSWPMRPGTHQGVHARYRIDGPIRHDGRAGLFDADIAVGQSMELEIGVPPLPPGVYAVIVDLIDVDQNAFSQFGVPPLTGDVRIDP